MALLGMQDVSIAFGGPPVLDHVSLYVERGERACLLGRNGAGKSTLMKVLDGTIAPDSGTVVRETGASVARLEQDVPDDVAGSTFDVVAAGLGERGQLLARYHDASHRVAVDATEVALRELDRLHQALDAADAWQLYTRVETVLSHLGLDADRPFANASGGRKRQTLLARALVRDPDVLLLDEPTNHLDIDAIEWLEDFLIDRGTTLLFVTHDRAVLRRVATRILEIDRGRLADWGGDYDVYLERKEAALAAEAREDAEFDKKLAREEVWIRTGIRARRTRNEGRVRALEAMRVERRARRERTGSVKVQAQEAERSGKLVVDVRNATVTLGGRTIVNGLSTTIMRGDRVGVIGPNGAGKTTLFRMITGKEQPDGGTLRLGETVQVGYVDQSRDALAADRTVWEEITGGRDDVELGKRSVASRAYVSWFNFKGRDQQRKVGSLSGGERNRVHLAKLLKGGSNLLLLDEPTNDLDVDTLRALEEALLAFAGCAVVISHDRWFLDRIAPHMLAFEGDSRVVWFEGNYQDYEADRKRRLGTAADQPHRIKYRRLTR